MNVDLTTRLRDAAQALHGSVAPEPPEPPRPNGAPILAISAVLTTLALLAGIAVLATGHDGDSNADLAAAGSSDLPRLLADWVPSGFELTETLDDTVGVPGIMPASPEDALEAELLSQSVERTVLFGDAATADPFSSGGIEVTTIRYIDGVTLPPLDQNGAITVRGRQGGICAAACVGETTSISWMEEPLLAVTIVGRSFSADQLAALAEYLSFDDDYAVLHDGHTLVELARYQRRWDGSEPTNSATYRRNPNHGELRDETVLVRVEQGSFAAIVMQRRFSGGNPMPVEVRGHPGSLVANGSGFTMTWEEEPGVVVTVVALSAELTEADLLRLAESLRQATDEEWTAAHPPQG